MTRKPPTPMGTVLVDTSLLVELQKRSTSFHPVKAALSSFRFRGISSFSKLEFKRAWLKRLAYLHSLCRQPGVTRIADVSERLEKRLAHHMQRRAVQTCFQALHSFLALEPDRISQSAQLARARQHFKHAVLAGSYAIKEAATGEFRGTACVRAEEQVRELADGSLDVVIRQCKPSEIRCAVHEFFENHRHVFLAIADGVDRAESPSVELCRIREGLRTAAANPVYLCDDKNCASVGDAIIAVDGRDMDVFAANNDSEWSLLGQVLGKTLLNPVSKGDGLDKR